MAGPRPEHPPVLVVEDDAEIRDSLLEILGESGYRVVGVTNGHEALRMLRTLRPLPCFILLDLMMPVMDGQAFREQQLEDAALARIPVVVISASRDVAAQTQALKLTEFLTKPLDLDELLALAARLCPSVSSR